jgi:hypothetical protein
MIDDSLTGAPRASAACLTLYFGWLQMAAMTPVAKNPQFSRKM